MEHCSEKEEAKSGTTESVFSKYYEYLPYNRFYKESVHSVLSSRETGLKSQCFYTRSICSAKFGSCVQPFVYPIFKTTEGVDKRLVRPRQFEYHPSDASLMAVGTLDGEVIILNHETGNVVSNCISPHDQINSVLGLCWLKKQPSKLLVGSDDGSLRLYDIRNIQTKDEQNVDHKSTTVIFDDFEQLTSVHVNSSDDLCLTSGYSTKVAIYDICSGQRLHLFKDMHHEPINVAKFANHSPNMFVTSSFDRDVKMWDLRQSSTGRPCYAVSSSRGNVMVVFSHDDLYLLVSAVDNEVKQLLAVDGRLQTEFGIVSKGSAHNYTRSYYMNGRDYIISGSCEEPIIRVCCAQTGRRLTDVALKDTGQGGSIFVQSLRSDPFRHFNMSVLAAYAKPMLKYEIIKVNLLSSSQSDHEEYQGGLNICSSYSKGG